MTQALLPDVDELHAHPELDALATLAATLALARDALFRAYPTVPDPLCPTLYAADVVLHHLAGLDEALAQYRAALEHPRPLLPFF